MFRELKAEEIEVRVGMCRENGLSLLLYKTSRVDADILDETLGPMGWQCEFSDHKGTLFCKVGIMSQDGRWVWKEDAGAPSNMEAEKGEASDAFKRACFKWGIGRALYTAPFIWVPGDKCQIVKDQRGKPTCRDEFRVAKVAYDDGRLTGVKIVNARTGSIVYSWRCASEQHDA